MTGHAARRAELLTPVGLRAAQPASVPFTVTASELPWQVNLITYDPAAGAVRGTVSHIRVPATGKACSAVVNGTDVKAADGVVSAAYHGGTGSLRFLASAGNLHFWHRAPSPNCCSLPAPDERDHAQPGCVVIQVVCQVCQIGQDDARWQWAHFVEPLRERRTAAAGSPGLRHRRPGRRRGRPRTAEDKTRLRRIRPSALLARPIGGAHRTM